MVSEFGQNTFTVTYNTFYDPWEVEKLSTKAYNMFWLAATRNGVILHSGGVVHERARLEHACRYFFSKDDEVRKRMEQFETLNVRYIGSGELYNALMIKLIRTYGTAEQAMARLVLVMDTFKLTKDGE